MGELEILNVREKMKNITVDDGVFKKIVNPNMNILNFSNILLED